MVMFYFLCTIISMLLSIVYLIRWNRRYNSFISVMFVVIPVSNMGHLIESVAGNLDIALVGYKLSYLGGCFCTLAIFLSILTLCKFHIPKYLPAITSIISIAQYALVLTAGYTDHFLKRVELAPDGTLLREYAWGHSLFKGYVILIYVCCFIAIILAFRRYQTVSRKTVGLLLLLMTISMAAYFIWKPLIKGPEITPVTYIFAQLIFLLIVDRISLYNVDEKVIDVVMNRGQIGVISFDNNGNYLGSNAAAKSFFPELNTLVIDKPLPRAHLSFKKFIDWQQSVKASEHVVTDLYDKKDSIYSIAGDKIREGLRTRGVSFMVTDVTDEQKYKRIIENYNKTLEEEVDKKTKDLVEMHDKFVLGMADMVENRDANTGGHIKRTSSIIRYLAEFLRQDPEFNLSDRFCEALIKAAPMHDIGKVAVDDRVLRKPGRFTDEEFEKMKTHSAKGAEILNKLLAELGDDYFKEIAVNVAHYHHERVDGSGYPEGLKGDEIPLEARIMAIADVYDALVSKRCYKDALSFEKADSIMREGMGSQFDKRLEKCYLAVRPKFEAYYKSLDQ